MYIFHVFGRGSHSSSWGAKQVIFLYINLLLQGYHKPWWIQSLQTIIQTYKRVNKQLNLSMAVKLWYVHQRMVGKLYPFEQFIHHKQSFTPNTQIQFRFPLGFKPYSQFIGAVDLLKALAMAGILRRYISQSQSSSQFRSVKNPAIELKSEARLR